MSISFQVITQEKEMEALQEEWNTLHQRTDTASTFVSFAYVRMWYTHFAAPDAVRIYIVRAEEKLVGLLPLVLMHHSGGVCELTNLTNDHCLIAPPLIAAEYREVVQQTLLNALMTTKTDWDLFTHNFFYSFYRLPSLFTESQLAGCGCLWKNVTEPTYAIFMKGTFAEYFTQVLSRNLRKNLKNAANRLNREKNVRYLLLRDEEVLTFWPKFLELEASGWKGQSETAIACTDTAIQQYYLDLIRLMSATHQIYLYGLEVDGVLVAGEFGYVDKDIFHHAKVAYNEQFAHLSPSHLLLLHILEDLPVHFPQIKLFHMFPWDTGYKQRFVDEPSFYTTTTLYSPTWRGRTLYALRWLKDQMKERMPGVVSGVKKVMATIRPTGN
ncbi:MAG: GNAT family N-acetyltransferase [Desulfobulbus oligotrophicus]|jgi:CelD/BcsL family acetyltransferase involved in cellulose biosynthesis|nr:GNAT family N-acetyltransferase [Desulfobulbus oligotrophicus]